MARQRYRGNTLSASFPLLSSFSGQTVIIPGMDQYYMSGGQIDHEKGIPEVVFMENVMPMANGLQSVGFSQQIVPSVSQDFDQAFYLRDSAERRTLYVPANGKNYIYDFASFHWRSIPFDVEFGTFVSIANIKGRQFVCYAKRAILEWDGATLAGAIFTGIDPTTIRGIVAANTYLVIYTETELFWSSTIDPTDFVPSLETGAGGTDILALRGNIVTCTPIADGFIIYTTANIVVALYTANSRFPWTFKELPGSTGIDDPKKVTSNSSGVRQFAATVAGLFALDRSQATPIWPEISEFFACRRYESYNFTTKKIEEFDINDGLLLRLSYIAERYLVISYGDNQLTHALIYDTGLKKWGKIRIDHVDCFDFISMPTSTILGPGVRYRDLVGSYEDQTKQYIQYGHLVLGPPFRYIDLVGFYEDQFSTYEGYGGIAVSGVFVNSGQEPFKAIGFLQANGGVKIVNFDLPALETESVLFLGRYQLTRGRMTELHEVWLENVGAERTSGLAMLKSYDGMNNEEAVSLLKDKKVSRGRLQKYFANEGPFMNCLLRIDGNFDLTSLEMVFSQAGYV